VEETIVNTFKPINIKELFVTKNPALAIISPGFYLMPFAGFYISIL